MTNTPNTPQHTPEPSIIQEPNGVWICTICGAEWSQLLADNEIPGTCPHCLELKGEALQSSAPDMAKRIEELEGINAQLMQVIRRAVMYLEIQAGGLEIEHDPKTDSCILCELKQAVTY